MTKTSFIAIEGKIPQKTNVYPFLDYTTYFSRFRDIVFRKQIINKKSTPKELDLLGLIKSRRSVRKWTKEQVYILDLKRIMEACAYAPTAGNLQAVRLKTIRLKKDIKFLCGQSSSWFTSLPSVIFLVYYDYSLLPTESWCKRFVWQDTACAMQNMMLMAKSLGLETCWASVNPEQTKNIKKHLKTSENLVLTCMLFLGYGAMDAKLEGMHQGRHIKRNISHMILDDDLN